MYKKDKWIASMVWGRIGAAVLCLAAFFLGIFGYSVTPEDLETTEALIASILAGVGGALAIVSKIRESKKTEDDE